MGFLIFFGIDSLSHVASIEEVGVSKSSSTVPLRVLSDVNAGATDKTVRFLLQQRDGETWLILVELF